MGRKTIVRERLDLDPETEYFVTQGPGGRIVLTPVVPVKIVVRMPDTRVRK